jgi:hypothetical protein
MHAHDAALRNDSASPEAAHDDVTPYPPFGSDHI